MISQTKYSEERNDATKQNTLQKDVISVLIVDDEPRFRSGLRRLFSVMKGQHSYHIYEAENGKDVFEKLKQTPPDCILLDYCLPGQNGLDLLKAIHAQFIDLPIVMITGHGDEEIAVQALQNGAMDYLVKGSISQESLQRAIDNAVEKVMMRLALETQRLELVEAEKQRTMIQSLGTACHHLGQPATSITCYLALMKRLNPPKEIQDLIDKCTESANGLGEVLHNLQRLTTCRTVPYRTLGTVAPDQSDTHILDMDQAVRQPCDPSYPTSMHR